MIAVIACLCGGIIEFGLIGASGVIIMIVNFVVNRYNRKCCSHYKGIVGRRAN